MSRRKSAPKEQDSLLISGINTSKIHKRLENMAKGNTSNLGSSRLELSSSLIYEDPIKVQDSISISEIYKEIEPIAENILLDLDEASKENQDSSEFFKMLEENTGAQSRHKAYSKLDESSIVGENCQVILEDHEKVAEDLLNRQKKKYYKAFMIMQANFVSFQEASERSIKSLMSQLNEVHHLIKENREFTNKLEASVSSRVESIKEEMLQKFKFEAEKLSQKYSNRETEMKTQTKNKIMKIRKDLDMTQDKVMKSFDQSKAKNSEDLLRKNCEMRLKIALMKGESQRMADV